MQKDKKSVSGKELGNGVSWTSLLVILKPQTPTLQTPWTDFNVGVRDLEWEGCKDHEGKSPSGWAGGTPASILVRPLPTATSWPPPGAAWGPCWGRPRWRMGARLGAPTSSAVGHLCHHSLGGGSLSWKGLGRAVEQQGRPVLFPDSLSLLASEALPWGNPHVVDASQGRL